MTEWISIIVNIVLVIVTISTVIFASKSLFMEHGGQVILLNLKQKTTNKDGLKDSLSIEFLNIGKRDILKVLLLVIVPNKEKKCKKKYFLSKPVLLISPNQSKTISINLTEKHIDYDKDDIDNVEIEVIYQDSLYKTYTTKPEFHGNKISNQHLEIFLKRPKRLDKYRLLYMQYKWKLWRAKKQGHTYPRMQEAERKEWIDAMNKRFDNFKNIKFEPIEQNEKKEENNEEGSPH